MNTNTPSKPALSRTWQTVTTYRECSVVVEVARHTVTLSREVLGGVTWRQVMIVNVIPGVLMSAFILVYLGRLQMGRGEAVAHKSLRETMKGFGALLRNNTLMMLSVSSAFRAMTQTSLLAFLPLYFANAMGYSYSAVGACMLGFQAAGFAASPIAGAMSDRVGRRNIIVSSMVMTGVVLLAMAFAGRSFAFVALVATLGFFLFAIRPVMQAWILDSTPKNLGGSAIGLLFGVQAVGAAIGPAACGLLADHYGLMATFYFMAATIVIANMFVFFIPTRAGDAAQI